MDSNEILIIQYVASFKVFLSKFGYGECIIVSMQSVVSSNNNLQLHIWFYLCISFDYLDIFSSYI